MLLRKKKQPYSFSHKIAVVGEGGVGKTAVTIQYTAGAFVWEYDPTIEDSYRKQILLDGVACMVEILDTAGCSSFYAPEDIRYLQRQWADAFIVMFSIASSASFRVAEKCICFARERAAPKQQGEEGVPMVLVGNKSDLVELREVEWSEAAQLAEKHGIAYVETSAKSTVNVEAVFRELLRELLRAARRRQVDHQQGGGSKCMCQ